MRCNFSLFFLIFFLLSACTGAENTEPKQESSPASLPQSTLLNEGSQQRIAVAIESRLYLNVEAVAARPIVATLQAPARLEFRNQAQATVGAVVSGRLAKIRVQAGDAVKAGAPLAELISPEAAQMHADIAHSKAELQRAEDRAKRQAVMRASGVGLEVERIEAEVQLRQARADYQRSIQSERLLGSDGQQGIVQLRAPISGVVLRIAATTGAAVQAGETLFELGEPGALRIVADVFEADLPLIATGASVLLQFAALPNPVKGHVAEIAAAVQADLRRASVYIDLDSPGPNLKPGMFAKASIQAIGASHILLPTSAVLIKDGKRTVAYVETAPGEYEARDIQVSRAHDGWVPVLAGLEDGERVVVSGALLLDSEAQMLL